MGESKPWRLAARENDLCFEKQQQFAMAEKLFSKPRLFELRVISSEHFPPMVLGAVAGEPLAFKFRAFVVTAVADFKEKPGLPCLCSDEHAFLADDWPDSFVIWTVNGELVSSSPCGACAQRPDRDARIYAAIKHDFLLAEMVTPSQVGHP